MMRVRSWLIALPVCAAVGASLAYAKVEELGKFDDWKVYVSEEGGAKHCFARSEPSKSEGKYAKRSETALTVSHRPKEKVRNEVSVLGGYTFKKETQVEVAVDGKKFFLFVDGDSAWAPDEKVDQALVTAMQKGSKLVVKGTSSRGTKTVDTYSLKGSSAALKRIDEACQS